MGLGDVGRGRDGAAEELGQVIWINGAFGAGKSSLASALCATWPIARRFDPEDVGALLRGMVPLARSGDFSDDAIWRELVVDVAVRLLKHFEHPLVVPMTVLAPAYLDEIFTGLAARGVDVRHYFLEAGPEVLRERIRRQRIWPGHEARDARVREWRLAQVDRCVAAVRALPRGTVLLDGELPSLQLAAQVLRDIGAVADG